MARETQGEVRFFGIAWHASEASSREYVEEFDVPYDNAYDADDRVFELYSVPYQPVTFFITRSGHIAERHAGPIAADELRARIEALIAT